MIDRDRDGEDVDETVFQKMAKNCLEIAPLARASVQALVKTLDARGCDGRVLALAEQGKHGMPQR